MCVNNVKRENYHLSEKTASNFKKRLEKDEAALIGKQEKTSCKSVTNASPDYLTFPIK